MNTQYMQTRTEDKQGLHFREVKYGGPKELIVTGKKLF